MQAPHVVEEPDGHNRRSSSKPSMDYNLVASRSGSALDPHNTSADDTADCSGVGGSIPARSANDAGESMYEEAHSKARRSTRRTPAWPDQTLASETPVLFGDRPPPAEGHGALYSSDEWVGSLGNIATTPSAAADLPRKTLADQMQFLADQVRLLSGQLDQERAVRSELECALDGAQKELTQRGIAEAMPRRMAEARMGMERAQSLQKAR
eukprot:GHVU01208984.1.p1 GENE.GHVU01208984.1~~GHVU01208984.1.p1  ORF type:complete len:210 (+),score=21.19 GHVU01208984.1:2404-3033(+)